MTQPTTTPKPGASADAIDLLEELLWRGQIHQATDDALLIDDPASPGEKRINPESPLAKHLQTPRRIYIGYDPTADSLTVGNMVTIMLLVHAARAGHTPVVVMGGGTGLIGDPSGKSAERTLQTAERVSANVEMQKGIFARIFTNAGLNAPAPINNLDWLGELGFIEVLRIVGKHFRVNDMVKKDSVRDRLDREQGVSFTEFSYTILQAYDFYNLSYSMGVSVQMGGSDQFGNIVSGTELIRKLRSAMWQTVPNLAAASAAASSSGDAQAAIRFAQEAAAFAASDTWNAECYGLTCPLLTKADGTKFGKTESGAIWLTAPQPGDATDDLARRTSAYAFFQFWLNASDADLDRYFKIFTLFSEQQIRSILEAHSANPGAREAQRTLAREITRLVHGEAEMLSAERAGQALFSGDLASLDARTLREVLAEAPSSERDASELTPGVALVDLLVETNLASSKRQAREFLGAGSVTINGRRAEADEMVTAALLLHKEMLAIRRGKKNWHVIRYRSA